MLFSFFNKTKHITFSSKKPTKFNYFFWYSFITIDKKIPQKGLIAVSKNTKISLYTNFFSPSTVYNINTASYKVDVLRQASINYMVFIGLNHYINFYFWVYQALNNNVTIEKRTHYSTNITISIDSSNNYRQIYSYIYQNKPFINYNYGSIIMINSIFIKQKKELFFDNKQVVNNGNKRYLTLINNSVKDVVKKKTVINSFSTKNWWYKAVSAYLSFFKSAKQTSNIRVPFKYNFGFSIKNVKVKKKKWINKGNTRLQANQLGLKEKRLLWLKRKNTKKKLRIKFFKKKNKYLRRYVYIANLTNRKLSFKRKSIWKSSFNWRKSGYNYNNNYRLNQKFKKKKSKLKKTFTFYYKQKLQARFKNMYFMPKYTKFRIDWYKTKIKKEKELLKQKINRANYFFKRGKLSTNKKAIINKQLTLATSVIKKDKNKFNAKLFFKPQPKISFYYKAATLSQKKEELFNFGKIKNRLCLLTNSRFSRYYLNAMSITRFAFDDHAKKSSVKYRSFVIKNSIRPRSFIISNLVKVKTSKIYLNKLTRNIERRFMYVAIFIKDMVRITFFCMFLKKANFIANFYAYVFSKLPRKRKETVFIRFLIKRLKSAATNRKEIIGIRFRFQGRVNRWRRTKFIVGQKGIWLFYSISSFVEFGQSQAVTRKGSQSIRIWLCYKSSFTPLLRKTFINYIELSNKKTS